LPPSPEPYETLPKTKVGFFVVLSINDVMIVGERNCQIRSGIVMNKETTKIFAHRGASGTHPENTMAAFQEAYRAQADGIEFDVQLTKDGIPVVIHDETVDRTSNGTGWVKDLTLTELKSLDAGSWFDEKFRGERIPTLYEVLKWSQPLALTLNIELKTEIVDYPDIEHTVMKMIEQFHLQKRVIISSFNHYSLVEAHRINPEIETAILFMERLYKPWEYARSIGARGIHCYWPVVDSMLVKGAAQAGMPIRAFTVNDDAAKISLIQQGCSVIMTDWP
jgi:glycerophosphoryl diester phosphodiesterase